MPAQTIKSLSLGLIGRCPACGQGALFKGIYALHETCPKCGARHERMEGSWLIASGLSSFLGLGAATAVMLSRYTRLGPVGITWMEPLAVALVVVLVGNRLLKGLLYGALHRMGLVTPDPLRQGNVIFLERMRAAREREGRS